MSKGSRDRTKDHESFGKTLERIRRNSAARKSRSVRLANLFEAKAAADKKEKK